MKQPIQFNLVNRALLGSGVLFLVALICLFFSTAAFAISPAPDGGYPNENTAEGDGALFSLDTSTGSDNTALGFQSLYSNTTGSYNTATGFDSMVLNTTGDDNTANGYAALYSNTTGYENMAFGAQSLFSNTTGAYNTAVGTNALYSNTIADENTAIGYDALVFNTTGTMNTAAGLGALYSNTTGGNTANGAYALFSNTSGNNNVAVGQYALYSNTTADFNVALGDYALYNNTTGTPNTATGYEALYSNTTGVDNVASGYDAMYTNTTGSYNVAQGNYALYANTTGSFNTATGYDALYANTTGSDNTAIGWAAMVNNTSGSLNTAFGEGALYQNTTGGDNVAIGYYALECNNLGYGNTAAGYEAMYNLMGASNYNTTIGEGAGNGLFSGSNNIYVGNYSANSTESNIIRIGDENYQYYAYVAGIYGYDTGDHASSVPVVVDLNGKLGTMASSARFKTDIEPMDQSSEAILSLRPVTFHYKSDSKATPQFGLIAEEVGKVNPDLAIRDAKGKIWTVRYDAVNAMLLNEFLKQHQKVEQLKARVAQRQKKMDLVAATLKEQGKEIQKVSAQAAVSEAQPQVAANNQ